MNIDLKVEGMPDLLHSLSRVERGLLDFRDLGAWDGVERAFYAVQKEIFDSEGAAGKGGKWAELSSPYKERKEARYGAKPILQAAGGMYREFTSKAGSVDKQAQEMTLGFSLPAAYHMGKGSRTKMPYRSSVDLTPEQERTVIEPILKKLEQLIDNARLRGLRGF